MLFFCKIFTKCLGKLIGAGGRFHSATDAGKALNGFLHLHSAHQSGNALRIARASSKVFYLCYDPIFNVDVPQHVDGVETRVLNPRNTWTDKDAYDKAARKLAKMFEDNAAEKYPDMSPEVRAAGPHSA